jgi:hypothetical protein
MALVPQPAEEPMVMPPQPPYQEGDSVDEGLSFYTISDLGVCVLWLGYVFP